MIFAPLGNIGEVPRLLLRPSVVEVAGKSPDGSRAPWQCWELSCLSGHSKSVVSRKCFGTSGKIHETFQCRKYSKHLSDLLQSNGNFMKSRYLLIRIGTKNVDFFFDEVTKMSARCPCTESSGIRNEFTKDQKVEI